MNYEKIGNFICQKRKELQMTQKELAEKIGVTDRAISRWERGIGCPDISILETLSNCLHVSVLELLHGEIIEDEKSENKVILNILARNKKSIRLWKRITFWILNSLLFIFVFFYVIAFLFPQRIQKNPNLFLYTIVSPSMEPTLNVYDGIVVQKVDIKEVQVGDIITYVSNAAISNGMTITHRVVTKSVDFKTGEIQVETKGDNNFSKDNGYVTNSNLIGRYHYKLPKIGIIFLNDYSCVIKILLGVVILGIFVFAFFYLKLLFACQFLKRKC